MNSPDLELLEAELRRDEGVRRIPYLDTSRVPKRTIGVGHNLNVSPLPAGWTPPLTDPQINQLLALDISDAMHQLDTHLPWWRTLSDVRMRVLMNMVFNMGISDLLEFKLMLAAAMEGGWLVASEQMSASDWYHQVGQRAVRLCEAMRTDVMPDEPAIAS